MNTTKQRDAELKPVGGGVWRAVLSSPEPDCVNDRVFDWVWTGDTLPLLSGHDTSRLPIGRIRPYKQRNRLLGELTFAVKGSSVASDEARALVEQGVAIGVSIGFTAVETPKANPYGGFDFPLVRVHEASMVGAQCCPECVVQGQVKCCHGGKGRAADTVVTIVNDLSPGEWATLTKRSDPEAEARATLEYLATPAGRAALAAATKAAVRAEFRRVTGRLD